MWGSNLELKTAKEFDSAISAGSFGIAIWSICSYTSVVSSKTIPNSRPEEKLWRSLYFLYDSAVVVCCSPPIFKPNLGRREIYLLVPLPWKKSLEVMSFLVLSVFAPFFLEFHLNYKVSIEIQGLSTFDCNFQGLSRPWIFMLKFKDFQDFQGVWNAVIFNKFLEQVMFWLFICKYKKNAFGSRENTLFF